MLFSLGEIFVPRQAGDNNAMADYSQSHSSEFDFKVLIRCVVKGYQECIFKVETGNIFTAVKKIGDYGRAFKVVDSKRGQLGHLQREVVSVLLPLNI